MGDALVMRGDVIHRTQDTETDRLAASFRVTCSSTPVHRERLLSGGREKLRYIMNNHMLYAGILKCFGDAQTSVLSVGELLESLNRLEAEQEGAAPPRELARTPRLRPPLRAKIEARLFDAAIKSWLFSVVVAHRTKAKLGF